jgi:hypothetical protein
MLIRLEKVCAGNAQQNLNDTRTDPTSRQRERPTSINP